jgi:hypothetical protein
MWKTYELANEIARFNGLKFSPQCFWMNNMLDM